MKSNHRIGLLALSILALSMLIAPVHAATPYVMGFGVAGNTSCQTGCNLGGTANNDTAGAGIGVQFDNGLGVEVLGYNGNAGADVYFGTTGKLGLKVGIGQAEDYYTLPAVNGYDSQQDRAHAPFAFVGASYGIFFARVIYQRAPHEYARAKVIGYNGNIPILDHRSDSVVLHRTIGMVGLRYAF